MGGFSPLPFSHSGCIADRVCNWCHSYLEKDEAVPGFLVSGLWPKAVHKTVDSAGPCNELGKLTECFGKLVVREQFCIQQHHFGHFVYFTDFAPANHIGSGAAKAQHPGRWKQQVVVMVAAVRSQISWRHWCHHSIRQRMT